MGTVERERAGVRGALTVRGLRPVFLAEAISGAGDGVFWVSLVVLLTEQPSFGAWLTVAAVARLAPRAILSLPAGALVDRMNLRRLLVAVDLVRGALMVTLAVYVASGGGPAITLAVVFLTYTVGAPTRPAVAAIIPPLASELHLAGANALLSTIRQTMMVIGPLLGAAVATASPETGFAINGVALGISGLIFSAVRTTTQRSRIGRGRAVGRSRRQHVWQTATEGLQSVRRVTSMTSLVALIAVISFVRGAELVLHVFVVQDILGVSVSAIGLLGGAMGFGAIASLPLAARAAASDHPVRPIVAALLGTAIPTAALAFVDTTLAACLLVTVVGASMVVFEVVAVVLIQRVTAYDELGGVFGAVNSAANSGKLLGALAATILVTAIGVGPALVAVGALVLVATATAAPPLVPLGRAAALRRRALLPSVDLLSSLAIFEGAPTSALERLADRAGHQKIGIGTAVITEGDEADDLYICLTGAFDVEVGDSVVATLDPVTWFGEIGLIGQQPRTATVRATRDSTVWRIPGVDFLQALEETGAEPAALVEGIADRLAVHP